MHRGTKQVPHTYLDALGTRRGGHVGGWWRDATVSVRRGNPSMKDSSTGTPQAMVGGSGVEPCPGTVLGHLDDIECPRGFVDSPLRKEFCVHDLRNQIPHVRSRLLGLLDLLLSRDKSAGIFRKTRSCLAVVLQTANAALHVKCRKVSSPQIRRVGSSRRSRQRPLGAGIFTQQ